MSINLKFEAFPFYNQRSSLSIFWTEVLLTAQHALWQCSMLCNACRLVISLKESNALSELILGVGGPNAHLFLDFWSNGHRLKNS